jgi:hypothetical protein
MQSNSAVSAPVCPLSVEQRLISKKHGNTPHGQVALIYRSVKFALCEMDIPRK